MKTRNVVLLNVEDIPEDMLPAIVPCDPETGTIALDCFSIPQDCIALSERDW